MPQLRQLIVVDDRNRKILGDVIADPAYTTADLALARELLAADALREGRLVRLSPLSITYDHRIVDGSEAVRFLVRIKELIEDPGQMLIEL